MENANCESYTCIPCNFKTNRKNNYKQHLESMKHKENTQHKCKACGKFYKHSSSVYRHRKECVSYINSKN